MSAILLAQSGLLALTGYGMISWALTRPRFFERFVGNATPRALASIRVLVCAILLASALWEDLASSALLPRAMAHPLGMLKLLHLLPIGFERFVANASLLKLFQAATILLLILGLIGWKTRFVIPLGGFFYFVMAGIFRQYAWFYHTGLIPIYVIAVLSLTPCGDDLSLDRFLKIRKGQPVPQADEAKPVYGWSRYVCWVALAVPYVAAGMSKIRNGGLFWWNATNMRSILYQDSLNPMQFDWDGGLRLRGAPDFLFAFLGITAVLGELSFGLVLFSRFARKILPPLMALMHLGISLLQNVLFFDLIFLQMMFYDFTSPRAAPAPHSSGRNLAAPLAISGLLTVLLLCWVYRVEQFPFTAMQMYTKPRTSTVTYYKVFLRRETGREEPARLHEAIRAMVDGRYRKIVARCFESSQIPVCEEFLQSCGSAYNRKAPEGGKVSHLEVQKWVWDFGSNPKDPNYGNLINRFVYPVKR